MLNAMRKGAGGSIMKFLMFGLLGMATLGLVMMDIGGFFRGSFGSRDVAVIDGEAYPLSRFDTTVRSILNRQGMTSEEARRANLYSVILNQQINERVVARAALDNGLRVSDQTAAQLIKEQLKTVPYGNSDKERLNTLLRHLNMSEKAYVNAVKREILNNLYYSLFLNWKEAPRLMTDRIHRHLNQKRVAQVITVSGKDILPNPDISPSEIREFYEDHASQFMTPEKRSFKIMVVEPDDIANEVEITEAEVRDYFELYSTDFMTPPSLKISQAVFETQADAIEALEALKSGKKSLSDYSGRDMVRVQNELTMSESAMPEALARPISKLQNGEWVPEPVRTSLGWHTARLDQRVNAEIKPFAEVRQSIKERLQADAMDDHLYRLAEEIDTMAIESETLDEIALAYNTEITTVKNMAAGETPDSAKPVFDLITRDAEELREQITSLYEGEISPLIETDQGGYALVQVTEITAPERQPFEEVEAEIRGLLIDRRRAETVRDTANKVITTYRKEKSSMQEIAAGLNLPYEQTRRLTRPETTESLANAEDGAIIRALFSLQPGEREITFVRPSNSNSFTLKVVRLADLITPEAPDRNASDYQDLRSELSQAQAVETQQQLLLDLRDRYDVAINHQLLDQAYGGHTTDME